MPLRDHFRPPLDNLMSWDGFFGCWPALIVVALDRMMPSEYAAGPLIPRKHPAPMTADWTEPGEYEVLIYNNKPNRRLVAAIEIVSPANKDRPEHRRTFVAKCAALLQKLVSVTIVDLVTTRNFNLYAELLALIGQADPSLGAEPPALYAASTRGTKQGDTAVLQAWTYALALGQPLPTVPLWLAENLSIPLELEPCYEDTCRALRIP